MNCKKMVLAAKQVRDAMLFISKDGSRPYLMGVYLEADGTVTATDGHSLYTGPIEISNTPEDFDTLILQIFGAVPKSATVIHVTLVDDEGFVQCRNARGHEVGRLAARAIDAKYPSYKQIIPSKDGTNHTDELCLSPVYLSRAAKIFPEGMRITFHGPTQPIMFRDTSHSDAIDPTIITIPVRSE